jgi:hypothetical protein
MSGGTERLRGLVVKWRGQVKERSMKLKRKEVVESFSVDGFMDALTACAAELEAALADSPRAMYRYAGELKPQPYEPESAAPARDVSTLSHESLKYLVPPELHQPAPAPSSVKHCTCAVYLVHGPDIRTDGNCPVHSAKPPASNSEAGVRPRIYAEESDLVMLIKRLCVGHPDTKLTGKAIDYLKRVGLQGSVLRERTLAEMPPAEGRNWKGVLWRDSIKMRNLAEEIGLHFAHDCNDSMCGEDADASNCEVAWIEDKLIDFLDEQAAEMPPAGRREKFGAVKSKGEK